jgi:glycosyltransferase involved in cell wall biosynthesis
VPTFITQPDAQPSLPRVLIVGSEDVDARIELMRGLADGYTLAAAGTSRELETPFAQSGFRYFYYPLSRGLGPASDLGALVALWRLLARFRPHIVHAFDTKPGVYACVAARLACVPVVVGTITGLGSLYGEHGLASHCIRGIYERMQRLASRVGDLTIFQNHDDREQFLAGRIVSAAKSTVIAGSGVRTDVLDPKLIAEAQRRQTRASLGIPAEAMVVTLVSRVIRSKGVEEFVAAAQRVHAQVPNAYFLLVGPADRNSVDRFSPAELAEFARAVHWPGARDDVPQILAASDLFVLPSSLREGIPRVLLEAASMGLPLITTDAPGCNDVVEDGVNGALVPAHDSAALSHAIVRLLGQPELCRRFGQASRQRAVERFDLSVVVEQTRRHYAELLARKANAANRLTACAAP